MPAAAVSIDVWDTLLRLGKFYGMLAASLAELLAREKGEVEESLRRARARVKELRAQGAVNPSAVIEQCAGILAGELGCSREVVKRGVARAVASLEPEGIVYEDALEALEGLASRGVPVVALSNVMWWPGYITRVIVEKAGLGKLLAAQVYADEVYALKPDARMFKAGEEALRDAGFEARLVAHAGDDFREDFLGAMSVGLVAVLVDRTGAFGEGAYFRGRGYIIRDLRRLARVLEELL